MRALVLLALASCASPAPSPWVAAYGAELTACVETARTSGESRACREDVMRRYGRLDGGAP